LRDHLDRHGLSLQPDHLILTGTALRLHTVSPGDSLTVTAGPLGAVRLTIVD
jgi:2-keto-4-pentenoate hydratase